MFTPTSFCTFSDKLRDICSLIYVCPHELTQFAECTQRGTLLSPPLLISRTLSQHLLELWWLYSHRYCCLPLLRLFLLSLVSSALLSLLRHSVINHTTGSGPASSAQSWIEKDQTKMICSFGKKKTHVCVKVCKFIFFSFLGGDECTEQFYFIVFATRFSRKNTGTFTFVFCFIDIQSILQQQL